MVTMSYICNSRICYKLLSVSIIIIIIILLYRANEFWSLEGNALKGVMILRGLRVNDRARGSDQESHLAARLLVS